MQKDCIFVATTVQEMFRDANLKELKHGTKYSHDRKRKMNGTEHSTQIFSPKLHVKKMSPTQTNIK